MHANYSTNEEKYHDGARILGDIYSYILAWTGPFEYETTSSTTPLAGGMDEAVETDREVCNEHKSQPI